MKKTIITILTATILYYGFSSYSILKAGSAVMHSRIAQIESIAK